VLAYFVLRRKDTVFPRIFWLFGCFVLFCGVVHLEKEVEERTRAGRRFRLVCGASPNAITVIGRDQQPRAEKSFVK